MTIKKTPTRKWIYGAGCPKGSEPLYVKRYENHNRDVTNHFKARLQGFPSDFVQKNTVKQSFGFLALLVIGVLQGCREDADFFFSGRPSGMAMAHKRVLDGTAESRIELLRILQCFPEVNASHKTSWQESVGAWWITSNGRSRFLAALPSLAEKELRSMEDYGTEYLVE
jgi:hypothetical protein